MPENLFIGQKNRILQHVARFAPGATTLRVRLHRWRGVRIGEGVWIGYDSVIETSRPHLVSIGDRAVISLRVTLVAHFRGAEGITIESDAFIGPCAVVLPNVTIGHGAVVSAGSVVTASVPPMTVVQGNPARPVARCGRTLGPKTSLTQFQRSLKPLKERRASAPQS